MSEPTELHWVQGQLSASELAAMLLNTTEKSLADSVRLTLL